MLWNARLGPGSPDDFMNAFDTAGWYVRVSWGDAAAGWHEYKGGRASVARAALAQASLSRVTRVGSELTYRWIDLGGAAPSGMAALTFCKFLESGAILRGAMILDRDSLDLSNIVSEGVIIPLVVEYFLMSSREALVRNEAESLKEFAENVSLSIVIVSRKGEILSEAGGGIEFMARSLGLNEVDHQKLPRKIEAIISKFESSAGDLANGAARCSASMDAEARAMPFRIIRLEPHDVDLGDDGVCYALVEAKEIELPDASLLCDTYDLTPAEARVVGCLIEGAPVAKISQALSLTDHTVRTYLKRSYNKIGVSGQAQMVSKLTRLSYSLGQVPKAVAP